MIKDIAPTGHKYHTAPPSRGTGGGVSGKLIVSGDFYLHVDVAWEQTDNTLLDLIT